MILKIVCVCYYFDDIINGTKIDFSNILLNKKWYQNISVNNVSCKSPTGQKPLRIRFDKIDGKKHLILFDYGLLDKNCVKKLVLQIVLIIILERSKLIHVILCLLKKY